MTGFVESLNRVEMMVDLLGVLWGISKIRGVTKTDIPVKSESKSLITIIG
jgi:hypothetical protein